MTKDRKAKLAAREIADQQGITYPDARTQLGLQRIYSHPRVDMMMSPDGVAINGGLTREECSSYLPILDRLDPSWSLTNVGPDFNQFWYTDRPGADEPLWTGYPTEVDVDDDGAPFETWPMTETVTASLSEVDAFMFFGEPSPGTTSISPSVNPPRDGLRAYGVENHGGSVSYLLLRQKRETDLQFADRISEMMEIISRAMGSVE